MQALPSTSYHIVLSSIVACSKSLSRRIGLASVQFSSITQLCLTLCDPMNHSTPGLPACPSPTPGIYPNSCPLNQWCHPTISSSVIPFSSCLQYFPVSGSFQMSQLFASGGQSIGVSASTSVLPVNTQDWSPLGWTSWISLQSKGFSRVFSNTTVQKHQFFCAQLSLESNSHIHTWLLEKPLAPELWSNHKQHDHYFIRTGADRHWGVSLIVHHSAI